MTDLPSGFGEATASTTTSPAEDLGHAPFLRARNPGLVGTIQPPIKMGTDGVGGNIGAEDGLAFTHLTSETPGRLVVLLLFRSCG